MPPLLDDNVRSLSRQRIKCKTTKPDIVNEASILLRQIPHYNTAPLKKMESVAVASSAGSGLDNFKHRESSPIVNKEFSPTIKKQNIRKRTKTGCLSRFYSCLILRCG